MSASLFGSDFPGRAPALRPVSPPFQGSLLDAAAERLAIDSGRNVAQVRLELLHGVPDDDGPAVWRCRCGGTIGPRATGRCDRCER